MFKKDKINYENNALEPIISSERLIKHIKNHTFYEKELEKSLTNIKLPIEIKNVEDLVKNYLKLPKELQIPIRQYGGGIINHNFFFKILKKNTKINDGELLKSINKTFNSFKEFQEKFIEKALNIFGSGWTWLVIDKFDNLRIYNTYNQDNPWFLDMKPLICIDIWEHAYFDDYNNDREKYIKKVLEIINWPQIEEIYLKLKKQD